MRLVKHIERGYGHAMLQPNGKWVVYFFDKYDRACIFSRSPDHKVLIFLSEDTDYV